MNFFFITFLKGGNYRTSLNVQNPLSSKGLMVQSYVSLLKLFSQEENGVVISPSSFKSTIGQLNSQFEGTDQQDAQEFLASLLDGLHEDLNQGVLIKGGKGYLNMENVIVTTEEQDEKLPDSVCFFIISNVLYYFFLIFIGIF